MKKLKTKEIADMTIELYDAPGELKKAWDLKGNAFFRKLKELCSYVIVMKYGKETRNACSATFMGYCAHYVYAYCIEKYGMHD